MGFNALLEVGEEWEQTESHQRNDTVRIFGVQMTEMALFSQQHACD